MNKNKKVSPERMDNAIRAKLYRWSHPTTLILGDRACLVETIDNPTRGGEIGTVVQSQEAGLSLRFDDGEAVAVNAAVAFYPAKEGPKCSVCGMQHPSH